MVRGCALIDSRLDTAKICSDGRVHVDHAQLPAVFGGEKTFSHGLGQNRKSSMRAHVFRFAPKSGYSRIIRLVPSHEGCRLPLNEGLLPANQLAHISGDDPPPSLQPYYRPSSLLRGSPPLSGASVLSASRF